ncbi:MAG: arginine--tRNA ligase [Phycisphaerales bacterium]|nr:MAG: arginine--tRNA ligase [Phycisphaerales bacterium]
MQSITRELGRRVTEAMIAGFGDQAVGVDPLLKSTQDPSFGDYQANFAMGLAKRLGRRPRDVAAAVVEKVDVSDLCDPPEIAGPGFINFTITPAAAGRRLQAVPPTADGVTDRVGIAQSPSPDVIAIDMSSPNLAKEMHVGHLRSTIIGDCIARVLEFEGHVVHRINHVGDWGTQFGMIIEHVRRTHPHVLDDPEHLQLGDLEAFYVEARRQFDADPRFADAARKAVVDLQGGDPETLAVWKAFCGESLRHCHVIYDRLDVRVEDRGESFYNDMLAGVVQELGDRGFAEESDGAMCVFLDGFTNKQGDRLPMIIRKSDGGYNYATTDLAALRHRISALGATRLLYVVGIPQKQHFDMLFAAARKAGWAGEGVELTHIGFGSMLSSTGKMFKAREGGTVKLRDLVDEAVERAHKVIEASEQDPDKRRGLSSGQMRAIAETVGTGAVKYFDLSHSLGSDYRFDWDTMLSMDGNTAPYMLYAYARIRSIGREAGVDYAAIPAETPIVLEHDCEIRLGKTLLKLPDVIDQAAREYRPNVLTDYLFELSKAYNLFYDRKRGVRVKDASPESVRLSRLRLCDLTARSLKLGLHLLGIGTLEQM